jgi:membrane-associated phospholipid phosphatase
MTEPLKPSQQRVEQVLEHGLEQIQTPDDAEAIVERIERQCSDQTEVDRARAAAQQTHTTTSATRAPTEAAATLIERAAQAPSTRDAVANALETTAAQAVAPTGAAPEVVDAAQAALSPKRPVSPPARKGRELLKEAALRRMRPWERFDARLYLSINRLPHHGWLDSLVWVLTQITMGGWIWVVGALLAYLLRVPRSWEAFERLLPAVVGATWVVEYPIKSYFRRRRPFVEIVRALVIGKKPGSWSFPSGHTASSFASAWVLSTIWRRSSPIFLGLASMVGFSRIYAGAHYPGDVASGAIAGTLLAELIRRVVIRILH